MSDQVTEITNTSWFARIKQALGGIVVGFLLVLASLIALFWNEGRAVKTATALNEGAGLVVTVDPANMPGDAAGKLVHFTGKLTPNGTLQDAVFAGVKAPDGSVRLVRKVEMYQWDETSETKTNKKVGGSEEKVTTYFYSRKWSEKAIDSSRFKQQSGHENPPMPVQSQTFGARSGTVGQLELKGDNFSRLGKDESIAPNDQILTAVKSQFGGDRNIAMSGNAISVSAFPGSQIVGDLRIQFMSGDIEIISVVGKLDGTTILPFTTSNGRKLSMYREGALEAKQMFDDALSNNTVMTWVIRLAGFVFMMIGFNMIFSIVGVLGDIIPFIGDVFRFATGLASFALAAVLSTLIIGIAWIYYRPLIGMGIIVIGLILAVAALVMGKSKARSRSSGTILDQPSEPQVAEVN